MRSRAAPAVVLLLVALGVTGWVFATVLGQRFSGGDVYPAYSTLRADPLGAKALHESLDRLPGLESQRNYRPLKRLEGGPGTTLVLLHVPLHAWQSGALLDGDAVKNFAAAGGRVVITLAAQAAGMEKIMQDAEKRQSELEKERREAREKKEDKSKEADDEKEKPAARSQEVKAPRSLGELVLIRPEAGRFTLTPKGGDKPVPSADLGIAADDMPRWYSKTRLDPSPETSSAWKVLATVKEDAVLVSHRVGRGEIIIATDSYFASNESLWKEPAPAFLAWLIGDAHAVIFDETHLSTRESTGIMTLARRHRLHGLFFGGLLLFALFIWQSSFSLIPPMETEAAASVSGHGAEAGLITLLRRGISRRQLLQKCVDTWEHGQPLRSAVMQARLSQARVVMAEAAAQRLKPGALRALYQKITDILHPQRS